MGSSPIGTTTFKPITLRFLHIVSFIRVQLYLLTMWKYRPLSSISSFFLLQELRKRCPIELLPNITPEVAYEMGQRENPLQGLLEGVKILKMAKNIGLKEALEEVKKAKEAIDRKNTELKP